MHIKFMALVFIVLALLAVITCGQEDVSNGGFSSVSGGFSSVSGAFTSVGGGFSNGVGGVSSDASGFSSVGGAVSGGAGAVSSGAGDFNRIGGGFNNGGGGGNGCTCAGRRRWTLSCCDQSGGVFQFGRCLPSKFGRFLRCCQSQGVTGSCST